MKSFPFFIPCSIPTSQTNKIVKTSTADYLKVVMSHIPTSLASIEALSRIKLLTQTLPPISNGYIECRLGKGQTRVDFIVALPCIAIQLPTKFFDNPNWVAFEVFSNEWTKPNSDLSRIIDYVWFEFDMIDRIVQLPNPCIAFTLNHKTTDDSRLREIAIESCLKLRRSSDSEFFKLKIQTCIDSLPYGASIAHIGVMLTRPTNAVRLVIKGIQPSQLINYLETIGWKDPTNGFCVLIGKISTYVTSISLALDLENNIISNIGLECFFAKPSLNEDRNMSFFLDNFLIEEGLCTSEKRNALLDWTGISCKEDRPDLWPSNLNSLDRLFSKKALSVFCRTISHIKIVYQLNGVLEAKAYLSYYHSYLDLVF